MRPDARGAYPLTARYDPNWIRENALGENALCQVESLSRRLPLRSGMRILDLACGNATSSIFLAREFAVEVWAADLWVSPNDNRRRAIEFGCERTVFPLRVDAHSLPFAEDFFDAVVAIDSYLYFGTHERYLSYLLKFVKPGGHIGVVDIGFTREIAGIADYAQEREPTTPENPIMWAVPRDNDGLIALLCLAARKRATGLALDCVSTPVV
jgi:cyclopropane fatty-acyl-phospholipid synthase-like methyltransferase